MGITKSIIKLTAYLMKDKNLSGDCITFGVHGIEGLYNDVKTIFKKAGYKYTKLNKDEIIMDELTQFGKTIHQSVFFKMLGFSKTDSIDCFPDENPSFTLNINYPIPKDFVNKYDCLWDGGTTEHVFNVFECLSNIVRLLKVGGRIIHSVPVSGYINHGYYQFSPILFFDFYNANGFTDIEAVIIELNSKQGANYYHYNPFLLFHMNFNKKKVCLYFTAIKNKVFKKINIPVQGKINYKLPAEKSKNPVKDKLKEIIQFIPFIYKVLSIINLKITIFKLKRKNKLIL